MGTLGRSAALPTAAAAAWLLQRSVGQLTDQCVESAVRDAADLGFFVTVVDDACAATGAADHAKGLAGMKGFSRVLSTDEIVAEIHADATSRSISKDDRERDGQTKRFTTQSEIEEQPRQATRNASQQIMIPPAETFNVENNFESKATAAIIRSLKAAGVEFLRYFTLDATNSIRCKAIPIQSIKPNSGGCLSLDKRASIAEVCFVMLDT